MAEQDKEQLAVFPKEANPDVPAGTPPQDDNPAAGSQADQGIAAPTPGDGTNVGEVTPRWGPEPGVTAIDRGSDPDVPAFIPDLVGPRTEADYAVPTQEERDAAAEDTARAAARQEAAGRKAADKGKK